MKILHLDIETAPNKVYAWGLFKQNIAITQIVEPGYTLCWAAKWHGEKGIMFNSIKQSTELEMVSEMRELLDKADAVVHYNGKKFDIPTLNKEFIQLGLDKPSPYHQIDLYHTVRSNFRFPSNKLDYVSQALGLGAKTQHSGMQMWNACMDKNHPDHKKYWKLMEKYNRQDVVLLPKLYKRLLPWIKSHPNHALYVDTDRPVCTNCGKTHVQKRGKETTKTQIYQRYQCIGCKTWMRGRSTIVPQEKRSNILSQV